MTSRWLRGKDDRAGLTDKHYHRRHPEPLEYTVTPTPYTKRPSSWTYGC